MCCPLTGVFPVLCDDVIAGLLVTDVTLPTILLAVAPHRVWNTHMLTATLPEQSGTRTVLVDSYKVIRI